MKSYECCSCWRVFITVVVVVVLPCKFREMVVFEHIQRHNSYLKIIQCRKISAHNAKRSLIFLWIKKDLGMHTYTHILYTAHNGLPSTIPARRSIGPRQSLNLDLLILFCHIYHVTHEISCKHFRFFCLYATLCQTIAWIIDDI